LSYQAELLVIAALLYLYDSSVLLYSNEAILTGAGPLRWSATTGWTGFLIAGRSLCVLNPFTPHLPSFRLRWDFDGLDYDVKDDAWAALVQEYRVFTPTTWISWGALFVLLPLGMFTAVGAYAVVPALMLSYGSTVLALFQLRRRRAALFPGRRLWGFAFECLACPPFAVNIVRRITLAAPIAEPVPLAAVRLLDAEGWAQLRQKCISRIDEALQSAAEDSDERRLLEAQKLRLGALVGGT
jgi:hypothetical protein